jgi:hypothetical protein
VRCIRKAARSPNRPRASLRFLPLITNYQFGDLPYERPNVAPGEPLTVLTDPEMPTGKPNLLEKNHHFLEFIIAEQFLESSLCLG